MSPPLLDKALGKAETFLKTYFPPKLRGAEDPAIAQLRFFAIRGFPKSGTNWLSSLMNLHPLVFSSGEFGFSRLAESRDYIDQQLPWTVCNTPGMRGRLDAAFEEMIKSLMVDNARVRNAALADKLWIGDKTPSQAYPPVIKNSKCLYIVRDVRDVTVSRAYHLLRVRGVWGLKAFPKMMEKMEKFDGNLQYFKDNPHHLLDDTSWVKSNIQGWVKNVSQVIGDDTDNLKHTYPSYHVQVVRYEDLHTHVEVERDRCYRFLGLDPSQALSLDSGKIKTSPGFANERPQEFYRKGVVGDWKNYFNDALAALVMEEAGTILKKLGYLN